MLATVGIPVYLYTCIGVLSFHLQLHMASLATDTNALPSSAVAVGGGDSKAVATAKEETDLEPPVAYNDGYEAKFFGDAKDHACLKSLTDFGRENELKDRADKRENVEEEYRLRKRLYEKRLKKRMEEDLDASDSNNDSSKKKESIRGPITLSDERQDQLQEKLYEVYASTKNTLKTNDMGFKTPKPLHISDRVAIVGPSSALATIFPHKRDLGMQRLQSVFGLEPVLYQSASSDRDSSPVARADDLIKAFADPTITAVICTIGGDDLIRLIPFLTVDLLCTEPKALLGFSDITALHLLLWKRGIVSYYGGNLMCQFAMGGDMHSYTVNSIRQSLFTTVSQELSPSISFLDGQPDWADPQNLQTSSNVFSNISY